MRAGYYTGDRTYEVREIPDREPEDDEVKIEVAWCGLCGTDIHKFEGKNGASPVIPPISSDMSVRDRDGCGSEG